MKTHSIPFSGILRLVIMASLLSLAAAYTANANAAQGCGEGYHRSIEGGCIANHPGAFAKPAPYHPGCWRNIFGQLRCYR